MVRQTRGGVTKLARLKPATRRRDQTSSSFFKLMRLGCAKVRPKCPQPGVRPADLVGIAECQAQFLDSLKSEIFFLRGSQIRIESAHESRFFRRRNIAWPRSLPLPMTGRSGKSHLPSLKS
jgi:hypothetical protein